MHKSNGQIPRLYSRKLARAWMVAAFFSVVVFAAGCQKDSEGNIQAEPTVEAKQLRTSSDEETKTDNEFQFHLEVEETASKEAVSTRALHFPRFTDISAQLNLSHTFYNGTTKRQLMIESTGGGAAWIDIDSDGLMDLYFPQGGETTPRRTQDRPGDQLFRQRSGQGFLNVTGLAGTTCFEYGQGVASADVNEDGFPDFIVTNVGPNVLFLNNGDGTFSESEDTAIREASLWSSSAAFGDVDSDGDLDLYVCNYCDYDPFDPKECLDELGVAAMCHPRNLQPQADHFFLNNGDGSFSRCEKQRGLYGPENRALCVAMLDLNHDGAIDIYVGNDTTANFFFQNDGQGYFSESAMGIGGGVSASGASQATMGIGVGDYDQNGFQDLCLTHFSGEYNTLYQNNGVGGLRDLSSLTGLRPITLPKLAFGVIMHDFNADGHQDLVFANGHIDPIHPDGDGYEMTSQVVSYDGDQWQDGSAEAGQFFQEKGVGRAIAAADFDQDGDTDLVLVRQNSATALLRNDSNPSNTIHLQLIGSGTNRNALGSYVSLELGNGDVLQEAIFCGESFCAANQLIAEFAIAEPLSEYSCRVTWPNGQEQTFALPQQLRKAILIQGHPTAYQPPPYASPFNGNRDAQRIP